MTDLRITRFLRADLKKRILPNPNMLEIMGNVSAAEQRDIDERAADLGRRSAEQRGARLMVGLVERISAYRIGPDRRYPFPCCSGTSLTSLALHTFTSVAC